MYQISVSPKLSCEWGPPSTPAEAVETAKDALSGLLLSFITVAMLAQGTSWAVADTQAFLYPGFNARGADSEQ